jgi:hypothetical protein
VHGENFSQSVFRKMVVNYLAESQELSEQLPKKLRPQNKNFRTFLNGKLIEATTQKLKIQASAGVRQSARSGWPP